MGSRAKRLKGTRVQNDFLCCSADIYRRRAIPDKVGTELGRSIPNRPVKA